MLNQYKDFLIARKVSLNYFNIIKIWLAYLDKQHIPHKEFTQEHITNFFIENSTYAIETRNQYIKAGKHYYTQFLQIPQENNEWYKIKQMRTKLRQPKFITVEELKDLIYFFGKYENRLLSPLKSETLINFMYFTGLRKAEILSLKREHINFNVNPCEVRVIGKGDKERFVYFSDVYSPNLKTNLLNYFVREPEMNNAFNLTLGKMNYFVQKMNKYLKDKNVTPHLFRHSFSRYLQIQGVSLTYIQKLLGHSSIQTTMRYLDPTQDMIKNVFKET